METNPITIKLQARSHMAEQVFWFPLPYCSPPGRPFPIKSLALSAHVSPWTIHFQVLDRSPVSGPGGVPLPATCAYTQHKINHHSKKQLVSMIINLKLIFHLNLKKKVLIHTIYVWITNKENLMCQFYQLFIIRNVLQSCEWNDMLPMSSIWKLKVVSVKGREWGTQINWRIWSRKELKWSLTAHCAIIQECLATLFWF